MTKIAKEGYPFIAVSGIVGVAVYLISPPISVLPFLLTLFMVLFFRDPERTPSSNEGFLCPADGRVIVVKNTYEETFIKGNALLISIFMSPFNVHVNRSPCNAEVLDVRHTKGKFFSAYKEEASLKNENTAMLLKCEGKKVLVRQVAGFLARRTVCRAKVGDKLKRGERFGIIKFGSRLDVFLPEGTEPAIKVGDKVKAGETVIGI
ncbi:MAG: phosphatidylserine decarboxylase family protein [Nitrospirae bacterium]|nr:phosphatidylserine decarboxylase family protein [Nitrospirota bacterium]